MTAQSYSSTVVPAGSMWVFGYGSLMWNPGFAFVNRSIARLNGYHRALCIHSTHYRGTLKYPGLVFGLDRGGVCDGVAFEVSAEDAARVLSALRTRELIYGVYREARVAVTLMTPGHPVVSAITYIAERAHPNYAGPLPAARKAATVRGATGKAGTNLTYVMNTLAHLQTLSLRDRDIERAGLMASAFTLRGSNAKAEPAREAALSAAWRTQAGRRQSAARASTLSDQHRFQHRVILARWVSSQTKTGGKIPPVIDR